MCSSRALGRCAKCIPRSTQVVQAICSLVIFGLFTTLMYGRSMIAVIQGVIGIIVSLEAYYSVGRGERWFLKWYGLYMLANTAVSLTVGGLTLSGLDQDCATAPNQNACSDTGLMYALIMTLGSSSVGIFTAISACLAHVSMREKEPDADELKL